MRCKIYGRKLTDTLSVWLGIGSECAVKRKKKPKQERLFETKEIGGIEIWKNGKQSKR